MFSANEKKKKERGRLKNYWGKIIEKKTGEESRGAFANTRRSGSEGTAMVSTDIY